METRYTTCVFCDGGCTVKAEIGDNGPMNILPANPAMPAICAKAHKIDEYRLHESRVTHPLRRVGERGGGAWQEITWDEALDEIAERLQAVVDAYGPEAFAVAEMPLNAGIGGITRRFMNCLGAVNYTAPVQLCMGNTAQVHRAVYGWFAFSNWDQTDCIVYFGQDRDSERWPSEYLKLKAALARGAKLIEIDPRETETAKLADYHLRIRYGTDAALMLAWVHVIIEEGLYDHDFVEQRCTGFDELRERVSAWTPERAAEACGISADLVRETARVYAGAQAAIIPWGVVPDMQTNSTSLIQLQCILRAICGFLNKSESVFGPSLGAQTASQLAGYGMLAPEQRRKQLGWDKGSILGFRASDLYHEANERAGIPYEPDILGESCACDPQALFAAMRGEGPYPVKALFSVANNTVMSYAGQQGIVEGLMDQDLVVVFENWMTPTAQLADYVLPGDMWAERDLLGSPFDVAPLLTAGRAFCEPVGACKNWYFVVKGLADRMGLGEKFPWKDEHELYDWRLAPLGLTFDELAASGKPAMSTPVAMGQFVTPSGKVELASSVIAALGFDPLPNYVPPRDPAAEAAGAGAYPYATFAGYRDRNSYNTNLHQIESLRRRDPEPRFFLNPADAERENVAEGEWCVVATGYGQVELMAHLDAAQPAGTLRVPHGWWKPETKQGLAAGLSCANLHNDGMLYPDDAWNLDPVQGVPGLRDGVHARIVKMPRGAVVRDAASIR
ncbi:molybdopterin-containing oxidoreductase family protein [Gordonibacter pamelaeae]|uniref:molybdopterin-containing oxidoreductase family protein n=1 Tax=Gordonibacter pamelaeae TaxID=471189 RepID=UPI003A915823